MTDSHHLGQSASVESKGNAEGFLCTGILGQVR